MRAARNLPLPPTLLASPRSGKGALVDSTPSERNTGSRLPFNIACAGRTRTRRTPSEAPTSRGVESTG